MSSRTEDDFIEWLGGASFYTCYARYGQLGGHGFVVASDYDYNEWLEKEVFNLNGGDIEALEAADLIQELDCWYVNDPNPATAMTLIVDKMRKYYFKAFNGNP